MYAFLKKDFFQFKRIIYIMQNCIKNKSNMLLIGRYLIGFK